MPYLIIRRPLPFENAFAQTIVGDVNLQEHVFKHIGATFCAERQQYEIKQHPSWVLDKLEEIGYRVVSSACNANVMVWTMHAHPAM
ncbi:hypothetical protein DPMN_094309 [Dreissena polymorpha]|uniref:GTP cyclohydrolase 1 feedback regulatory protein n=1 Tax=Dreissena polymorpha TaxID=45954 RepID=A0A9D4R2R4_DREPO|nr:hypothetical protein DPMN_094309 [Dreissena polymorpha]